MPTDHTPEAVEAAERLYCSDPLDRLWRGVDAGEENDPDEREVIQHIAASHDTFAASRVEAKTSQLRADLAAAHRDLHEERQRAADYLDTLTGLRARIASHLSPSPEEDQT